jgi:hypothetical protein
VVGREVPPFGLAAIRQSDLVEEVVHRGSSAQLLETVIDIPSHLRHASSLLLVAAGLVRLEEVYCRRSPQPWEVLGETKVVTWIFWMLRFSDAVTKQVDPRYERDEALAAPQP